MVIYVHLTLCRFHWFVNASHIHTYDVRIHTCQTSKALVDHFFLRYFLFRWIQLKLGKQNVSEFSQYLSIYLLNMFYSVVILVAKSVSQYICETYIVIPTFEICLDKIWVFILARSNVSISNTYNKLQIYICLRLLSFWPNNSIDWYHWADTLPFRFFISLNWVIYINI